MGDYYILDGKDTIPISDETLDEVERERAKWDAELAAIIKRHNRGEKNLHFAAITAASAELALRQLCNRLRAERGK